MAVRVALERVAQLPCPFRCPPLLVLPLGLLALDTSGGFVDGEAAEVVGLDAEHRDSRAGVSCVAVRAGGAHAELVAAGSLWPVLADQQGQAFLFVAFHLRSAVGPRRSAQPGHAEIDLHA